MLELYAWEQTKHCFIVKWLRDTNYADKQTQTAVLALQLCDLGQVTEFICQFVSHPPSREQKSDVGRMKRTNAREVLTAGPLTR